MCVSITCKYTYTPTLTDLYWLVIVIVLLHPDGLHSKLAFSFDDCDSFGTILSRLSVDDSQIDTTIKQTVTTQSYSLNLGILTWLEWYGWQVLKSIAPPFCLKLRPVFSFKNVTFMKRRHLFFFVHCRNLSETLPHPLKVYQSGFQIVK